MKKNVLFFSISIGSGHDLAARALEKTLIEKNPEIQTKLIDTFDYINPTLHKVVFGSYLETLRFTPKVWGYLYHQVERGDLMVDLGQIFNKLLSYKLQQLIDDFKPDIIICTHAFPAGIISLLKAQTGLKVPVIVIITDYTIHAFWIHQNINYYVIPSDLLGYECTSKGMLQDRIKPFGIPIRKEFIDQFDKNSIKKELGLDARPVVLVMGGGFGLGAVQETVQTILNTDSNLQILAITGKNLHLQTQLAKVAETDSNLHVYGYIDNISQFMSASDLIVTKPGGVTIAEVLAKKLPMIIIDPLPGQEDGNTEFLLNWGVAVKPGQFSTLPSLINHLFGNNLRMKQMREMAEFLSKPYAADDITNLVIDILVN